MIGLEDRCSLAHDIQTAHDAGARLSLACDIAGIDVRTLQRWKAHGGLIGGDGRPQAVRPVPGHALSEAERAQLLQVANEPRFAAVPPARIVPMRRRGRVPGQRVQLRPGAACARAEPPSRACQGAARGAPAHHAHRHGATSGVVLGHDLPAGHGGGALVPPVPDPGPGGIVLFVQIGALEVENVNQIKGL